MSGNRAAAPGAAPRASIALAALLASVVGVSLALPACAPGPAEEDGRIAVVATTGMIADAARRIGGDRVRVVGLMGPGVDPHLYKASAGDLRRLAGADLILYNGLHLEAAMGEVLAEMDGRTRTVAVSDALDRSRLLRPPEFEGAYDPHIWFDVALWADGLRRIEEAFAELDPERASLYAENARRYREELDSLHRWVRERVADLPAARRVLVTAHDAFNYFGRAYGFEVRGLLGISTASEAGTGDVQRLADFIVERGVPAIFVETSVPRRTVEAVQAAVRARGSALEIGGDLFSDAMGDAGTPEGSYLGMVRHNVNTIVEALGGGGMERTAGR